MCRFTARPLSSPCLVPVRRLAGSRRPGARTLASFSLSPSQPTAPRSSLSLPSHTLHKAPSRTKKLPLVRLSSTHSLVRLLPSTHTNFTLRAPPSFGRVASASANRERTSRRSLCLSSLPKQGDESDPSGPPQRGEKEKGREISPRPCRASIRPSESVTTRCSFDGECR